MRKITAILADVLTLIRGVTIPHLLIISMFMRIKSTPLLFGVLFGGWITDFYDGTLARLANQQSFIGAHEIVFDLSFIVFVLIYALFVLPVPWWINLIAAIFIVVAGLSTYGTLRHKTFSFIAGIEVPFAPTITAALMGYGIIFGSTIDKIMISLFAAIGLMHYKTGLRARKRAAKFISTLPQDLKRIFYSKKDSNGGS